MSGSIFNKLLLTIGIIIFGVQMFYLGKASARNEQLMRGYSDLSAKWDKAASDDDTLILQIKELQAQFKVMQAMKQDSPVATH